MIRPHIGAVVLASLALTIGVTAKDRGPMSERYAKALQLYAEARYQPAFEAFDAVLAAGDASLADGARRGRIRTALRTWRFDLARQDATMIASQAAADADAVTLLGDALWASGWFDEADLSYQRALMLDPGWARARFGVARSALSRGRLSDALREASAAERRAPGDPEICMLTGETYERQLRFDLAWQDYQRCLPLVPRALRDTATVFASKIKVLRSFAGLVPVAVDDDTTAPTHTVPFRLDHNKILVSGRLNGTATDFVVDTGAERTTLSREIATRARVRIVAETDVAGVGSTIVTKYSVGRADVMDLGSMRIRNVPVVVRPEGFSRVDADNRESFSPIALGLSVVVDYQKQQLTLGRTLPESAADITLPMRAHYLPMVRGVLNDAHPAYFVVDTGGELMSISQDTAEHLAMPPQRRIPINVWGATGPDREAFLLPGVNLDLGTIAYRNYPLAVLNLRAPSVLLGFQLGGILGHGFLSGYEVALDFGRGELRLRKNAL